MRAVAAGLIVCAATLRNPEWEDWTLSTGICPEFRRQLWRPRRLSLSSQDLALSPRWQLLGGSELGAGIPAPSASDPRGESPVTPPLSHLYSVKLGSQTPEP